MSKKTLSEGSEKFPVDLENDTRIKKLFDDIKGELKRVNEQMGSGKSDRRARQTNRKDDLSSEFADRAVCPVLRAKQDSSIRYGYPDGRNCCYKHQITQRVTLEKQERICLTARYAKCPVYVSAPRSKLRQILHKLFH